MKPPLHAAVLSALRRFACVRAGVRIGVAVSGGADSVALLFLLHGLSEQLGSPLRVLHFNHQLRGAESDEDEQFVRALAVRLGVDCTSERAAVRALAEREGWNLEDAGRRLRTAFFEKLVAGGIVDRVAVAHSADDQAETVLMHLLRGTGLAGLSGILPETGVVFRPLLEIRRADLRAYLEQLGETWREDATNFDTSRLRARIRHQLLPLLEKDYQPSIADRLGSLAALARHDEAYFRAITDALFPALVAPHAQGFSIAADDLLAPQALWDLPQAPELSAALSGRLVRRIAEAALGRRSGLAAHHVASVLRLARQSEGNGRLELPGLLVEKRFADLFFLPAEAAGAGETESLIPPYQYDVCIPDPGHECIVGDPPHRWRVKAFDWPPQGSDTTSGEKAPQDVLDGDLLTPPFLLRSWQPGDWYRPVGRRSGHKLKRLFWEAKIPAAQRASWPVFTSAGRIVWARRFGAAAEFAAGSGTRKGVRILEDET